MFYFCNSEERHTITKKGRHLLKMMKYTYTSYVIYQPVKNREYQYILQNVGYILKCEICKKQLSSVDSKLRNICTDCKTVRTRTLDRIIENECESITTNIYKAT
jgi:hypothetical protein